MGISDIWKGGKEIGGVGLTCRVQGVGCMLDGEIGLEEVCEGELEGVWKDCRRL